MEKAIKMIKARLHKLEDFEKEREYYNNLGDEEGIIINIDHIMCKEIEFLRSLVINMIIGRQFDYDEFMITGRLYDDELKECDEVEFLRLLTDRLSVIKTCSGEECNGRS